MNSLASQLNSAESDRALETILRDQAAFHVFISPSMRNLNHAEGYRHLMEQISFLTFLDSCHVRVWNSDWLRLPQ